jgi:FkbM family methyltransferase
LEKFGALIMTHLSFVKKLAEVLAPSYMHERRINRAKASEYELEILKKLTSREKISVDVGANIGLYTMTLIPLSAKVIAFEPIPALYTELLRNYHNATIHQVALSNSDGTGVLAIPRQGHALAAIDGKGSVESDDECERVIVTKKRLDFYNLQPVGFLKIDVEGHEELVIEGAIQTIERDKPNLLVELEERHNPGTIHRVRQFLAHRGYNGYFYDNGHFVDIRNFDIRRDQDTGNVGANGKIGRYINNFIFTHGDQAAL